MISVRPAEPEDLRFICNGWVASWQESNTGPMVPMEMDWRRCVWQMVGVYLARPSVRTIVAYETDDDDRIADLYGFIVADKTLTPPLVYYVFVAGPYRRAGIARRLFDAIGIDPGKPFSMACTSEWTHRLKTKIPMARWRPVLARYGKEPPEESNADRTDQDRTHKARRRHRAMVREVPTETRRAYSDAAASVQVTNGHPRK